MIQINVTPYNHDMFTKQPIVEGFDLTLLENFKFGVERPNAQRNIQ